jgi:hypothetical protein
MKVLNHDGVNFIDLLKEDINNIKLVIKYFKAELKDAEKNVELKGKRIVDANIEHVGWYAYYDSIRVELRTIVEYVDIERQHIKSKIFKKYKENYSVQLGQREIDVYIAKEVEILNINNLYLEIYEVYERSVSIVESFRVRGYNLKNITQIICSEKEDFIM